MNRTVVVFGSGGQDGFFLAGIYRARGFRVVGVSRTRRHERVFDESCTGDVNDWQFVDQLLSRVNPSIILQLAAISKMDHALMVANTNAIFLGLKNVLDWVYRNKSRAKIFFPGSALQFHNVGLPISEESPFQGGSPYSVCRIAGTFLARYYRQLGVRIYIGYLFNHESRYRTSDHLAGYIISGVRSIVEGKAKQLEIGDLNVEKEWTHAIDTCHAIALLVEQDELEEAVIGSGVVHSVRDFAKLCFERVGLDYRSYVISSENYFPRYKRMLANPERIFSLGWRPKIEFDELVDDLIGGNDGEYNY